MSRAMSYIMAVFVLVPVVAPSVGALIVAVAPWRLTFWFCAAAVVVMSLWVRRLPETLDPADRRELRWSKIIEAARIVLGNHQTIGYTVAMTFTFGVFMSYLASSELIIGEIYDRPGQFPFVFGSLAVVMGVAMLANARIVQRIGLRRLVQRTLAVYSIGAVVFVGAGLASDGRPPYPLLLFILALMLGMHALLIPNFNALAMEPMGRVAGTASAIIGTITTAAGAALGAFIDRAFSGSISPLAYGFLVYGAVAAAAVVWGEQRRS
jgi:DHA1 family bicyclomycin/chloramphenicol resistance-like MFS transporter